MDCYFSDHKDFHVWIVNSKGELLICRRMSAITNQARWEPLRFDACRNEDSLMTIVREVRSIVGLSLTPSLGKQLWVEDCGDEGMLEVWRFDYPDEDLDQFFYSKPDISAAIWCDTGSIRELYLLGLFCSGEVFHNLQGIVGEIKSFSAMLQYEMLMEISSLQNLSVQLLQLNVFPDIDIVTKRLDHCLNQFISKWNLEGTKEADYQRILAYSRLAHANMIAERLDRAETFFMNELEIVERNNRQCPDSTLLYWMANIHFWLADIYHNTGRPGWEAREKVLRAQALEMMQQELQEEMDNCLPGKERWGDHQINDRTIYDDHYILSMAGEDDFIALRHYRSDHCYTKNLVISDYSRSLPICGLTDSLYSELSRLRTVTINTPSLRKLTGNPFAGCKNLERILVSPVNTFFKMVDNILITGDGLRTICCIPTAKDTICTVPDGVRIIGKNTFYSCTNLKKIILPDSVEQIEEGAFYHCTGLEEIINLPKNLSEIGDWVFANCCSLKHIDIPDSVKRIGEFAFSECASLTRVIIPDSADELAGFAFSFCESLTEIQLPAHAVRKGYKVFEGSPIEEKIPE